MKKMTGIRLVNWHAFQNEIIDIHNSVMISGENAAGKSTILDAIQFVLTCSKSNFNKAANESSKRTLEGYVRYKTGKEEKSFERTGNVTAHVALEFYEERKREYSVIGVVVDSASETSSKTFFYRIENKRLRDIEFLQNNTPRDIADFKIYGKSLKMQNLNSSSQAREDFTNRLGNLNNKFFELLPKALAFKPIGDVKEFVYSYILDEKEVNIDDLRQNIRTYREFEELLEEVKVKVSRLKEIKNIYEGYQSYKKNEKLNEYIILRSEEEGLLLELENLEKEIEKNKIQLININEEKEKIEKLKREREELKTDISVQLNSNGDYQAVKGLDTKIEVLKEKQKEYLKEQDSFRELLRSQKEYFKILSNRYEDAYLEFYEALNNLNYETSEEFCIKSTEIERYVNNIKEELNKNIARLEIDKKKLEDDLSKSKNKIEELKKRNLQYSEGVKKLRDIIIEESKNEGRIIKPKILCEVLEITDPIWKDAVEGYLNTQRFYFLVERDEFDKELKIYERYRKKNNIYNVGIINVAGLEKYDQCEVNTLANIVISKSKNAKRFINYILGNVIRCNNVEELKKYRTSITATCMIYKNNVARAIDPKIYKTPYIGADAYKIQLEQEEKNYKTLKSELDEITKQVNSIKSYLKILNNLKIESLREKQVVLKNLYDNKCEISKNEEEKRELEKNSSYIGLKLKIDTIDREIENLRKKLENLNKKNIDINTERNRLVDHINSTKSQINLKKDERESFREEFGELATQGEEILEKKRSNRELQDIILSFNRAKLRAKSMSEKAEENLKEKMREYNNCYSLGAEVGVGGINIFIKTLDELEKSKVIEYEEKVKDAKRNAEEEFKHHFIAKLKANIDSAKAEFKELNRGLRGIYFGNEAYEFKIGKSNDLDKYHDMVMDDENIVDGFNLFTEMYQSKYKELLDELFEKLTLDNSNSEAELRKFTDYRNYMDYDIQINYKDGSYSLFSKVCKEKSGGETQTPYYVVIASSFLQLYKSAIGRETIGLILFDEAFDKMDDARIAAMMEFFKNLDLQVIIASPPQKIEAIAPYVNTTLLAMKIGNISIIEEYRHEGL